jgi:arylsulfatase A-like enzyme
VLDGLAANGLKLTQGYANSPVCSPTRFAMITARYQYRLRGAAEEPINSSSRGSTTLGLPTDHPTLPSLLKASGYQTALIGKWHLGYPPHFGPLRSGYDEFFGPMSGGVDYFTHCDSNGQHDLWFGEEDKKEDGYLTDMLSKRAVDYVERMARATSRSSRSSSACTTPPRTGPGKRATTPRRRPPSRTTSSTWPAATSTCTAA